MKQKEKLESLGILARQFQTMADKHLEAARTDKKAMTVFFDGKFFRGEEAVIFMIAQAQAYADAADAIRSILIGGDKPAPKRRKKK